MDSALVGDDPRVTSTQNVHVVTNRAIDSDGTITSGRSADMSYFEVDVSVPADRAVGSIPVAKHTPNPSLHFAVAGQTQLSDGAAIARRVQQGLRALPVNQREVTVYVHGYNNTFSDAAFRIAQLKADLNLPGEVVAFSWASRASAWGYEYDEDSVLVARAQLVSLLDRLNRNGAQRIVLVGHSMGAFLAMEALRTADLEDPGFSGRALSGVVLVSPDLDIDVFRSQAQSLHRMPEPFLIFTSQKDRALRLSAILTGEQSRLGNLSKVSRLEGLPVQIIDVTAFANERGPNHFTAGSSPALLAMLRRSDGMTRDFLKGRSGPRGLLPGVTNVRTNPTLHVLGPQR